MSETSSSEKHLANFFKTLGLKCFGRCLGDWLATCLSRKKRVFCVLKTVFKLFFSFSLEFLWLFTVFPISLSTKTDPNTPCHPPQTPFLHHLFSNLQEKSMGFLCLTWFFHVLRIIFLIFELSLWFEIYCVRTCFCLDCWVSVCLVSSLCVFRWLYTNLLYIVTNIGSLMTHEHSLSFSGHSERCKTASAQYRSFIVKWWEEYHPQGLVTYFWQILKLC